METYSIIRHFQDNDNETIETGLTLADAQEHCNDPETSSKTCSDSTLEDAKGPWFDGYTQE